MKFSTIVFAVLAGLAGDAVFGEEIRPGVFRTPEGRFANLVDYPFEAHYIEYEGLRMHYLDEGPAQADPILLMHGEPSWSYLYRNWIPALVAAGHRVIAPDLIGFGKSDKPAKRSDHSYQFHVDSFTHLLEALDLDNITLFCQDWGGLIGLRLVAGHPEAFARVIAANTGLPAGQGNDGFILGAQWTEPDPNAALEFGQGFLGWLKYSQTVVNFDSGFIVQSGTERELSGAEMDAYRAPFPDERYLAAARVMPALVMSQQATNREAWKVLETFEKPFLTLFSEGDAVSQGGQAIFQERVPGAKDQPHRIIKNASHFLQEDATEELVRIVLKFIEENPAPGRIAMVMADDFPVAHTPEGYWKTMPPPVLEGCTEPIVDGAPDMRGLWKAYSVEINGKTSPSDHIERIEQCGNRVVVTSSGVTHDMRCDGTYENGVNDISGRGAQPISVAAFFENGIHVLRPKGMDGFEVTRELDGDELIWRLGPMRVTRMRRID